MQCARDVRVVIQLWVFNRWPDASASGKMRDHIKFFAMKQISYCRAISKIVVVNGQIFGETADVCPLDLRIVKVVEVIEDTNLVSGCQQRFSKMGANETRAARD